MTQILFVLLVSVFGSSAFAQSEQATVTFNDGLIFTHDPNNFKMKFRFRLQGRATYEDYDNDSPTDLDTFDFAIRRMRLRFEGQAFDPRLIYKIQLSFSRGDMDYDNTSYPNILRDAVLGWKLTPQSTLFIGQTKLPGNRQRVISSGNLEFVDRSLLNAIFNIDRDFGVQLWSSFGQERPLWVKLALSNGEGRGNSNEDTGMATTGRIEWLPLGNFEGDEADYLEADMLFEKTPKLAIGATYSMNKRAHRLGGQIGRFMLAGETRDMSSFFADFIMKYRGWAVSGEFGNRKADNPIINPTQTVYVGHAVNAQVSYVFSNFISPSVRFTQVWPEEQIYLSEDITTQYAVGISKYFNRHNLKLQSDFTFEHQTNPLTQMTQDNWIARLQLQVGI